jgi:hypothetical protein
VERVFHVCLACDCKYSHYGVLHDKTRNNYVGSMSTQHFSMTMEHVEETTSASIAGRVLSRDCVEVEQSADSQ